MAPTVYYRVEDEQSRARYIPGKGIFAEDSDSDLNFRVPKYGNPSLHRSLGEHLDWEHRDPTPFISMYDDEDTSIIHAEMRVENGKQDVRIYKINTSRRDRPMEYRNVRKLAWKLDLRIPYIAWHNSKHEYVFLHHVPESTIEEVLGFD